jgi:hypothetical protein
MVRNKSDQTEASHGTSKLDVFELAVEIFNGVHIKQFLLCLISLDVALGVGRLLPLTSDSDELTVAVVNQLNKRIFTSLSRCSVIEETF